MSFSRIIGILVILWSFIYTASYGGWTWKNNKFGAVMIYIVAIVSLALPLYTMFFIH